MRHVVVALMTLPLLSSPMLTAPAGVSPQVLSSNPRSCLGDSAWGICTDNDGTSITIDETRTDSGGAGDDYSTDTDASGHDSTADSGADFADGSICWRIVDGRCLFGWRPPAPDTVDGPAAPPSITTVTSSDLAAFAPVEAVLRMEPNGWAILHKPVNFWVEAAPHQQTGPLFNRPVTVEFRPSSVRWDFGDGNGWTTETLGASWADLGLPELSSTATSHVYTRRGTYTVTATVHYTATVYVDGRSIDVAGEVSGTASAVSFQLYESSSVLVPNRP